MLEIKEIKIPGYQRVVEGIDPKGPLHCFIAIHDTSLGPALGGTRIYPYSNPKDALQDALRLSKAMTYKSAVAQDGMGGGKSVIIADARQDKNEKLLLAFAEVIDFLGGQYIAAEDVGTTTEDMMVIRKRTPYVCALPTDKSSGDPSRFTAWGVFRGMQAVAKTLWNTTSLKGVPILIQGLGNVGSKLANLLFWEGAELIFTDIDEKNLHKQAVLYGADIAHAADFSSTRCAIFAPCALGGILNADTISKLQCQAVAGGANNQLLSPENGLQLQKRGILYAPDYIINAGGIINAAAEFDPDGYNPKHARDKVNRIYDILFDLFARAVKENKAPSQLADEIAEYNIRHKIGKRQQDIVFKKKQM